MREDHSREFSGNGLSRHLLLLYPMPSAYVAQESGLTMDIMVLGIAILFGVCVGWVLCLVTFFDM